MSDEIHNDQSMYFAYSDKEGCQKFMIGLGKNGRHLTFLSKGDKDTFDIHLTLEKPRKKYIPLIELPKPLVHNLFKRFYDSLIELGREYWCKQTMNVGKMSKYNFYLTPVDGKGPDKSILFKEERKGKKYSMKKKVARKALEGIFLIPEAAIKTESNVFIINRYKNAHLSYQGMAIKNPIPGIRGQFWFIRNRTFMKFVRDLGISFREMLRESDFPNKDEILLKFDKLLETKFPTKRAK